MSNSPFPLISDFCLKLKGVRLFRENLLKGDRVVSCITKNLHYHYPLHLQKWRALKYIFKKVWGYWTTKPSITQARWAFPAPLFRIYSWLWSLMLRLDIFNLLSGHQLKASVTVLLIALLQEEFSNSVLIYILREMFLYFYEMLISDTVKFSA